MNPTNQETRAYIVHATPEQMDALSCFDFAFMPRDTFRRNHEMQTVDFDALRMVLEAANNEREYYDECANNPGNDQDEYDRKKADALGDAIAKIEAII